MARSVLFALLLVGVGTRASAQSAMFRVDRVTKTPSIAIATIDPRPGAAGYTWLRIYFYASLTPSERKQAETGGLPAQRTNWAAVLQLGLDKAFTVRHVDMSVPGHTCTIAASEVEARSMLQVFRFDGHQFTLRTQGSHTCDFRAIHIPNQQFEWDVDLTSPVGESRPNG